MSGKTEYVFPSAAEQLRAEETRLRMSAIALANIVEVQAEALIPFLAECVADAWEWDGSGDPIGGEFVPDAMRERYERAARALGIL